MSRPHHPPPLSLCKALPALLFLLPLALSGVRPSSAACRGCGGSLGDRLCGPKSLLLVCARLGITADLEELTELAETDERGATMAGLQKAAQRKGLDAVGVKISATQLATFSGPAICHLWGGHFVVVEPGPTGLTITDPSSEVGSQEVPLDQFTAAYSGFALLLSKDKVMLPHLETNVPDLRFDEYLCDLGTLDEGTKVERAVSFRNVGERDLTVSRVRATCTCIAVGAVTKTVPPGDSGSISFTYDASGLRGAQAQALYLESNDPVSPLVQVQVAAGIRPARLLASTRQVNFGDVDTARGATREMYLKDPGDGSLEIRDVTSDSPSLDLALAGAARPEGKEQVFPLRVSLKPGAPVGPFHGRITLLSNHPKEPTLTIPVTARIRGDIETRPETLFLGIVQKGRPARKSTTLLATSERKLSITQVQMSSDLFTAEVLPTDTQGGYRVMVSLTEAAPAGLLKAEMVIHTDSEVQPTIMVPVSAYVEDREKTTANNSPREVGDKARLESAAASARPAAANLSVVRLYVFTSQGCSACELVSRENMQAIAAKVGCRLETQYFDVDSIANWRKLTELEAKRHDTENTIPVVFIGSEVLSGEEELAIDLETMIAKCAAAGGTAWPDELE